MTNRRDRLRRGLPCIGPARSLGRHTDGGWWSFRSYAPASTESFVGHRGTANTRPCEPPAPHDPLLGSPLEKPYPMSPGVLRSCRSSKWRALRSPRLTHTGYLDHRRKPMEEPNLRIARGDAHTVLFREQRGDVPNARSRTGRRRALSPPARSRRRTRSKCASETPTPLSLRPFGLVLHPVPSRAPNAAAVASELRRTHGLGARPRLAKGMSRRLQQSTIFIFQRRTPTSCIEDSTTPEPLGRAPVEESLRSRRGSRFGASMRCHPVLRRVNHDRRLL